MVFVQLRVQQMNCFTNFKKSNIKNNNVDKYNESLNAHDINTFAESRFSIHAKVTQNDHKMANLLRAFTIKINCSLSFKQCPQCILCPQIVDNCILVFLQKCWKTCLKRKKRCYI